MFSEQDFLRRTFFQTGIREKAILFLLILCTVLGSLSLSGCAGKNAESDYYIYYLNQDMTAVVSSGYEPEADEADTEAMVAEFLACLDAGTDSVDYQKPYTDSVAVESYEIMNGKLNLHFNSAYEQMSDVQEILCRTAICWTLLQIDGITGVRFFVGNSSCTDANGDDIGVMTMDSFADNPSEGINSVQTTELTLYFAAEDGQSLVSETQEVYYYTSNVSMEKLVVEQLLEGPESDNAQSAIPEGTSLVSVSVMDGVCIVNLDDSFLSYNYEISAEVVIYSIVNSLTELSTVDKVQISVNGSTDVSYRQELSLTEYYSANPDLISGEAGSTSEEDDTEELLSE